MPVSTACDLFSPDCPATRFYNLLPGDQVLGGGECPPSRTWDECAGHVLAADLDALDQTTLDDLTLLLLAPDLAWPGDGELHALANRCSRLYIQAFRERSSRTLAKMSLQRLNFCLRALLDRDAATPTGTYETPLEGLCPWDWLDLPGGTLRVMSGTPNIVLERAGGERRCWRQGLPTQADIIAAGEVAIGSFYSAGASLLRDGVLEQIEHVEPVVLVFDYGGRRLMLDAAGGLFDHGSGELLLRVAVGVVARARRFDSRLYVIDWTTIGRMQVLDLDRRVIDAVDVAPVLVPNDIVEIGRFRYLLDKQQGAVFKFDEAWRFVDRRGAFGRGPGRLFDPLTVRPSADGRWLRIVNWVPATMSWLPMF